MNFEDLHELLRIELLRRIGTGLLTGTAVAREAGFKQAHISNFLNGKRSLSLSGLDRVLAAQKMTVDQMMPLELNASCSDYSAAGRDGHSERGRDRVTEIPVISPSTAMEDPVVAAGAVIEMVSVSSSVLEDCRARSAPKFAGWRRFVAVRAEAQQAGAMAPMIAAGATVVLDRHYNSLAPYRAHQRTLYAVRSGGGLMLRFLDFDEGRLILRPLALEFPVQLVALGTDESPADYIVGRVCLTVSEL